MSMKLNQTWLRIAAVVILAIVVGLVVWNIARPGDDAQTAATGDIGSIKLKTNEDRIAFIRSFGWEVNESAVEVMEVAIPKEFDAVYSAYSELQKSQGLDLQKYAGKRAKRWSYAVLNYPDQEAEVRVNLLISDNRLIACDLSSTELNGFMSGIAGPST
ncbi:MAG TPA: DUF4830 domain-containing protein [Candidatus Acidoferrum sp.]|nr:DUF4830 domain-containing protein [Candidatus Acidoferrum sp.]